MTLCLRAKVLLHVSSYDSYNMTLSTELQRRRMINSFLLSRHKGYSFMYMSVDAIVA